MRRILLGLAFVLSSPAHAEESQCLAQAASRYVGETERNLSRSFAIAAQSDVVLLFDEADALFGARTDESNSARGANDRYANQEVSYLLHRIERYEGVIHLASNMRRTTIAGFDRRSRYAGLILIETETGVRAIEFTRADRRRALAYAEASLEACPVTR